MCLTGAHTALFAVTNAKRVLARKKRAMLQVIYSNCKHGVKERAVRPMRFVVQRVEYIHLSCNDCAKELKNMLDAECICDACRQQESYEDETTQQPE